MLTYIFAFGRCFYPKDFYFIYQYCISVEIKPMLCKLLVTLCILMLHFCTDTTINRVPSLRATEYLPFRCRHASPVLTAERHAS